MVSHGVSCHLGAFPVPIFQSPGQFWGDSGLHFYFSKSFGSKMVGGVVVNFFFVILGVEAWMTKEKKDQNCDFADPYNGFAWSLLPPGCIFGASFPISGAILG